VADGTGGLYILKYTGAIPATEPDISLSAQQYDFGDVLAGEHSDWNLTISNVGDASLMVDSITSDSPAFTIVSPNFPQSILPGNSLDVTVRFLPSSAGSYSSTLTIVSKDPDEPEVYALVEGTSVPRVLAMEPGWNLISIPLRLSDDSLDTVLQSIDGHYSSAWTYDTSSGWKRHVVGGPGHLNNLQTIESGKGYWIDMADSTPLILNGDGVADDPIPIEVGWNLVGYNCLTVQLIGDALSRITGNYSSVWAYDAANSEWEMYIADGPSFLSNLEVMEPGRGYCISGTVGCEWNVSTTALSAAPHVEYGRSQVPCDKLNIPYTIWGNVEVGGVKVTGTNAHGHAAPVVLLKADDEVRSSYRLGEVNKYGDFYVLDVPGTTDTSAQFELYIRIGDAIAQSVPVPTGKPGQIIRFDLSVQ
jgi:hypothetical protein